MQNTIHFQDLQSLIQKQIKVKTYNLPVSDSEMDEGPWSRETYELKKKNYVLRTLSIYCCHRDRIMAVDITLKRGSNRRHIAVVGPYQFWNLAGHSLPGSPTPGTGNVPWLVPSSASWEWFPYPLFFVILPCSELLTLCSESSLLLRKKYLVKLSSFLSILPSYWKLEAQRHLFILNSLCPFNIAGNSFHISGVFYEFDLCYSMSQKATSL